MTVPREPARTGIDPYHELIDRDRKDNLAEAQITASGDPSRAQGGRSGLIRRVHPDGSSISVVEFAK